MLKSIIAALLLTTATPATYATTPNTESVPVEQTETEKAAKEMDDMMSIFTKMFDTSNLPAPEPVRLDLAKVTASKLLPDGAYAKIMDGMFEQMLTPIMNILPGLTNEQIVAATGASEEDVAALTEEKKAAVTQIIDPQNKDRGKQIIDVMKPMISEAMAVIEPAMRTGLSRAYARKFTAAQLMTINGFFTTPTGAAFARESFALQADPEVMQATFKELPAIFSSFMSDEAKFKAKFDALPKQRELKDLSETEMQQLAGLLGVEIKTLEDHRKIATATEPLIEETGDEPWYSEENWTSANRKKAAKLAQTYNAASDKSSAAYSALEEAQANAIDEARERMLAEGWTPAPAPSETTEDAVEAVAAL
jgi:Uncharacterized protein conserved in bacteria (DUF2059)